MVLRAGKIRPRLFALSLVAALLVGCDRDSHEDETDVDAAADIQKVATSL